MTEKPGVEMGYNEEAAILPKRYAYPYSNYYSLHYQSIILRTCTTALRKEIFRRKGHWIPRWKYKCPACGKEYDYKPAGMVCEVCASPVIEPDTVLRDKIDNFLFGYSNANGQVNAAGQTLWQVLYEFEDDQNIADDGYIVLIKEYEVSQASGKIISSQVKEIVRAHPQYMFIVGDQQGNRGGLFKVCPIHRDQIAWEKDKTKENCPICGAEFHPVHYVCQTGSKIDAYYIPGEVIHRSKYSPSTYYGISPIATLYKVAVTLIQMEDTLYSAYSKKRMPSGILSMVTRNIESMKTWWVKELEKVKADRDYIPIIAVDPESKVNGVEFVKFLDSIKEMEYIPTRDEMRQRVSALYGVSNIFMADTSTSGGLNNEGLQLTVTNRATADGQSIYNESVFPPILDACGLQEWKYELLPSEEEDEMAGLERESKRIQNARDMRSMGFKVDLIEHDEEDIRFEYSGEMSSYTNPFDNQPATPGIPPSESQGSRSSGEPAEINRMLKTDEGYVLEKLFWEQGLSAIREGALFEEKYQGLTKDQSQQLNDLIKSICRTPEWDHAKLIKQIIEKIGIDKDQAEMIVRTEMTSVANKAREIAYEKRMEERGEEFKFKWVGPDDDRTSDVCKEIKGRINKKGGAVKLETLKDIIETVSKEKNPRLHYRDFVPHINCRHKMVRVVD